MLSSLFDIELILSAVISGISNIHLGVSNLEIIIYQVFVNWLIATIKDYWTFS